MELVSIYLANQLSKSGIVLESDFSTIPFTDKVAYKESVHGSVPVPTYIDVLKYFDTKGIYIVLTPTNLVGSINFNYKILGKNLNEITYGNNFSTRIDALNEAINVVLDNKLIK